MSKSIRKQLDLLFFDASQREELLSASFLREWSKSRGLSWEEVEEELEELVATLRIGELKTKLPGGRIALAYSARDFSFPATDLQLFKTVLPPTEQVLILAYQVWRERCFTTEEIFSHVEHFSLPIDSKINLFPFLNHLIKDGYLQNTEKKKDRSILRKLTKKGMLRANAMCKAGWTVL